MLAGSLAVVAGVWGSVSARTTGISDPGPAGYLERAREMERCGNSLGTIDQVNMLELGDGLVSDSGREEASWLLARACYGRGEERCVELLKGFALDWPASPHATEALVLAGDYLYGTGDWSGALVCYAAVDPARLNAGNESGYCCRKAVCLMRTGHYAEAKPLVARLKGKTGYGRQYRFYNAYLDYIDGNFKDAYRGFESVGPGDAKLPAACYMAQIEFTRGEYGKVAGNEEGLLADAGDDTGLRAEMERICGLSWFKLGNRERAEKLLKAYLGHEDTGVSEDALYALGVIAYDRDDREEAFDRLTPLLNLTDALGQGAWLLTGQCWLGEGDERKAAVAFERAYRLNADPAVTEQALYNYGAAVTRGSGVPFSTGSELLERFAERYPDSEHTPAVHKYLATAFFNDGHYEEALEYADAIAHPDKGVRAMTQKILYALGVKLCSNGDRRKAVPYLRRAASMQDCDAALAAQSSLWLGDALYSQGEWEGALKAYETFLKRKNAPNRALGLYGAGYALFKSEAYGKAASYFKEALQCRPGLDSALGGDALVREADCLYYTGDYSGARALYSKALSEGVAGTDYILYRRSTVAGLSGDKKGKMDDLLEVTRTPGGSEWARVAWKELAAAYEASGEAAKAADAYNRYLSASGEASDDELLEAARLSHNAGEWERVVENVRKAKGTAGLEPDQSAELELWEAEALAALGRRDEAKAIYSRLAENPLSAAGAQSAVKLGEMETASKDWESARDRMEEFTDSGTSHEYWLARGFIVLADALHGLGETYLAREYLNSLIENYPGEEQDIRDMTTQRLRKWK